MVDVIKRFDKNAKGQVVLYKIVGLDVNEKGEVFLSLRVGIPKTEKKKEYSFKLDYGEIVLMEELLKKGKEAYFEKITQELRINKEKRKKEDKTKEVEVKEIEKDLQDEFAEDYEIEKIPDF